MAVLTFEEVLVGLLIGVFVSLLALIFRTSDAQLSILGRLPGTAAYRSIRKIPEAIQMPGLMIVRPDESVFFADAASLRKAIRRRVTGADPAVQVLLLELELTNELDVPSAEMLAELHEEMEMLEIRFLLAGLHAPVQEMLDRSDVTAEIGLENIYPTVLEAVLGFVAQNLDIVESDDVESVIARIDALTQLIANVSEQMNEQRRSELAATIDRFEELRGRIETS